MLPPDNVDMQAVFERLAQEYGTGALRDDADPGHALMQDAREQEQRARHNGARQSFVQGLFAPYRDEQQALRTQVEQLQGQLRDVTLERDLHAQREQFFGAHPQTLSGVAAQSIAPYVPSLLGSPVVQLGLVVVLLGGLAYVFWAFGQRLLPAARA